LPVATAGPAAVRSALTVLSRALVVLLEMAVARRRRPLFPAGFDALRPKDRLTNLPLLELANEIWETVVMSSKLLSKGRADGISIPLSKLHASFFVSDDDSAGPTTSSALPCRLAGALTCPELRRDVNLRLAFSLRPSTRALAALDAEWLREARVGRLLRRGAGLCRLELEIGLCCRRCAISLSSCSSCSSCGE